MGLHLARADLISTMWVVEERAREFQPSREALEESNSKEKGMLMWCPRRQLLSSL